MPIGSLVSLVSVVALLAAAPEASTLEPEETLRAGVIAGEPLGLSLFVPLGDRFALHAELGKSFSERRAFAASADLVLRMPQVLGTIGESGRLVPWFGAGARIAALERDHGVFVPGIRTPVGLSYVHWRFPLEIFAQAVPGLELDSARRVSLEGGAGLRLGF